LQSWGRTGLFAPLTGREARPTGTAYQRRLELLSRGRLLPPLRGRSSRGRASLTVRVRPWNWAPFRLAMASSAPADISTKAKPRDRPVSRSETSCAETTLPCSSNSSRRSSALVLKERLPTYNFLLMVILSGYPTPKQKTHGRPGRRNKRRER